MYGIEELREECSVQACEAYVELAIVQRALSHEADSPFVNEPKVSAALKVLGWRWFRDYVLCPDCSATYLPNSPRFVYLAYSMERRAFKVGTYGLYSNRAGVLLRNGFMIFPVDRVICLMTLRRSDAAAIERETVRWWREDLGLPPAPSCRDMTGGGGTETVSADLMSGETIWKYLCKQARGLPEPTLLSEVVRGVIDEAEQADLDGALWTWFRN